MLLTPPRPAPRNSFDDSGDFSRDNFGFNSSGCASVFIGRLGQAFGLQYMHSQYMHSPYGISRPSGGVIIPCLRFLQYREVSSSAFPMPQYLGIVGDTVSCPFSLPPVGRCVIVHLKFWFFQEFLMAVFQSEAVAFHPDSNLCSSSSEGSLKIATWAPKDALLMYVQAISGWTSRQPLFM